MEDKSIEALQQLLEHFKLERNKLVKSLIKMEEKGKAGSKEYQYLRGRYEVYKFECKTLAQEIELRKIVVL